MLTDQNFMLKKLRLYKFKECLPQFSPEYSVYLKHED